jgi:hypothetical protein
MPRFRWTRPRSARAGFSHPTWQWENLARVIPANAVLEFADDDLPQRVPVPQINTEMGPLQGVTSEYAVAYPEQKTRSVPTRIQVRLEDLGLRRD